MPVLRFNKAARYEYGKLRNHPKRYAAVVKRQEIAGSSFRSHWMVDGITAVRRSVLRFTAGFVRACTDTPRSGFCEYDLPRRQYGVAYRKTADFFAAAAAQAVVDATTDDFFTHTFAVAKPFSPHGSSKRFRQWTMMSGRNKSAPGIATQYTLTPKVWRIAVAPVPSPSASFALLATVKHFKCARYY